MIGTGATKQSLAFITGWIAKQSSPNNTFAPPSSIQAITDWEEKIFQMAVYYVHKNVTCLSSVSTYILMLLQKIESAFNGKLFSALKSTSRMAIWVFFWKHYRTWWKHVRG